MEGFPAQPPQPPTNEDKELEEAKKEMHMSGRAIRIDETLEEYRTEREKSWAEQQAKKIQAENVEGEKTPLSPGEQKINEYVGRILSGESKDSILQGLPESIKTKIEDKLTQSTEAEHKVNEDKSAEIPTTPEETAASATSSLETSTAEEKTEDKKIEAGVAPATEDAEQSEKHKELQTQMEQLIEYAWKVAREGAKDKDGNFIKNPVDFKGFLERGAFAQTMYDSIHSQNSPSHQEMWDKYLNNPEFADFEESISDRLVTAVSGVSKVRHITPKELIDGGQPDQAKGFVWFKGNAPRPANAREVRFYVNAKPEGVIDTATHLAKISDLCDQYGLRLQYKFRKDIKEYDRSDTCVAYLYIPEAKTEEQQANSDNWLKFVAGEMGKIPQEDVKENVSLFTEKVADGVAYIEDSRSKDSKSGESYTSQIAQMMGKVALEYASKYDNPTPDMLPNIVNESLERLKAIGY